MPKFLAELGRVARSFQQSVPWEKDFDAYVVLPLAIVVGAWGAGLGVAGFFSSSGQGLLAFAFSLLLLLIPALFSVFLTYFYDLLEIGLGWRAADGVVQLLVVGVMAQLAGGTINDSFPALLAVGATWVIGVQAAADLAPMRPDRMPRNTDAVGKLRKVQAAYEQHWFASLLALVLGAGTIGRYVLQVSFRSSLTAGLGAGLFLVTGLFILAAVRSDIERTSFHPENVYLLPGQREAVFFQVSKALGVGLGVGLLFPANLSPWRRLAFNDLLSRITDWMGPIFTRGSRIEHVQRVPNSEGLQGAFGFLDSPVVKALGQVMEKLLVLVLLVVLVLGGFRLWGLLHQEGRRRGSSWADYERGVWRQLWRWLKNLWKKWGRGAVARRLARQATRIVRRAGTRASSGEATPTEDRALILYLYRQFLQRGRQVGRPRAHMETAREYSERLLQSLPPQEGADVAGVADMEPVRGLTAIYESVRYGRAAADAGIARKCAEFWQRAVNVLRRFRGSRG